MAEPSCPACKRELDPGRTLQGQFDGAPLPGPLIACSGCLAVVAMEPIPMLSMAPALSEVPSDSDVAYEGELREYEPKVRILGASVARALDSLRDPDTIVPAYEAIVSDPALALALRVPEVFAIARSALRGGAVCSRMIAFAMQRGSRAYSTPDGGAGVEGTWLPMDPEMEAYGVPRDNVENVVRATHTDEHEPGWRFFPALLQAWEGEAVLVEGARVEVAGEDGMQVRIRPRDSRHVAEKRLIALRVPLDFLRPDPDAP